jgi:hypothetical protein
LIHSFNHSMKHALQRFPSHTVLVVPYPGLNPRDARKTRFGKGAPRDAPPASPDYGGKTSKKLPFS